MNPRKLKHEEDECILEDFLKLRPTRAIDRMLGENPVEKVFDLYGQLQYQWHHLGKRSAKIQQN